MYRLPSPFHHQARDNALSAAGGGSTTTTCCCTLVTAGVTCIATSVHFAGLAQAPAASEGGAEPTAAAQPSGNKVGLAILGFFALPLVALVAVALGERNPVLGLVLAVGGWIGLFALVYDANKRRTQKGVVVAIVSLLIMAAVGAVEISIWIH
ncbi:hypothetical protein [Leeia sp.]|uniref:hypothetical protein n=1 Tax=Leeia sp. TaxID=2884678 RepID=UPI0035B145EC